MLDKGGRWDMSTSHFIEGERNNCFAIAFGEKAYRADQSRLRSTHLAPRFDAGILADCQTMFCAASLFKCLQGAKTTWVVYRPKENLCGPIFAKKSPHCVQALLKAAITVDEVDILIAHLQRVFANACEHP